MDLLTILFQENYLSTIVVVALQLRCYMQVCSIFPAIFFHISSNFGHKVVFSNQSNLFDIVSVQAGFYDVTRHYWIQDVKFIIRLFSQSATSKYLIVQRKLSYDAMCLTTMRSNDVHQLSLRTVVRLQKYVFVFKGALSRWFFCFRSILC